MKNRASLASLDLQKGPIENRISNNLNQKVILQESQEKGKNQFLREILKEILNLISNINKFKIKHKEKIIW